MRSQPDSATLDGLLDAEVRRLIEQRFWEPVEASATIEVLRHDEVFLANPTAHPSMFADHGVVHVRDIAASFIGLATTVNGRLLAARPSDRQTFLLAYGLLITYLHDTGMFDQTSEGRRVHAVFGAQLAFSTAMDDVIDLLVEGSGPVIDRLQKVDADAPFLVPIDMVLREVMSLTVAHSKSTVPPAVLDDRAAFRRLMMRSVFTDLGAHKASGRTPDAGEGPIELSVNIDRYDDPTSELSMHRHQVGGDLVGERRTVSRTLELHEHVGGPADGVWKVGGMPGGGERGQHVVLDVANDHGRRMRCPLAGAGIGEATTMKRDAQVPVLGDRGDSDVGLTRALLVVGLHQHELGVGRVAQGIHGASGRGCDEHLVARGRAQRCASLPQGIGRPQHPHGIDHVVDEALVLDGS